MNRQLLRYYVAKRGWRLLDLAVQLGIAESTLYRKLNGTSDFTRTEIQSIKGLLQLEGNDVMDIFFS